MRSRVGGKSDESEEQTVQEPVVEDEIEVTETEQRREMR